MRRTLSFFIGVILGGLAGAVIALLFAPESGPELRIRLRERADNLGGEIRQAAATKRIELQERLDTLRAPRTQE
ncbi:MAG: YtxH domain-containing protein [Anaerolineales bacterium]|nr:YtxH domain-containing protein [Anaerolineales bacterium]MDP3186360.1 YtxH domain-containing protein [Anaerolineales bacterium]